MAVVAEAVIDNDGHLPAGALDASAWLAERERAAWEKGARQFAEWRGCPFLLAVFFRDMDAGRAQDERELAPEGDN